MKEIEGYEGLYSITSCGKVWSHRRNKFLKPRVQRDGYLLVNLIKDKKQITFQLHRLVAMAYLPNPQNLPCINHKDENKKNNNINNLEWCDHQYNSKYYFERHAQNTGRTIGMNGKKIICVETGEIYPSINFAARELGIDQGTLSKVVNKKDGRQTAKGYHFEYYKEENEND